jgi:hypothetical protein
MSARAIARLLCAATLGLLFILAVNCNAKSRPAIATSATSAPDEEPNEAEEPVEMSVDNMARQRSAGDPDCNGNGIQDSLDIARGFASDINRNGHIDECDPDSLVAHKALTGNRWWRFADIPDTSHFAVVHGYTPRITIRYTVPPTGASVRLSVLDSTGTQIVNLVSQTQANGPYVLQWDRTVRGQALKPGSYTFRLYVGRHRHTRTIGWANW